MRLIVVMSIVLVLVIAGCDQSGNDPADSATQVCRCSGPPATQVTCKKDQLCRCDGEAHCGQ